MVTAGDTGPGGTRSCTGQLLVFASENVPEESHAPAEAAAVARLGQGLLGAKIAASCLARHANPAGALEVVEAGEPALSRWDLWVTSQKVTRGTAVFFLEGADFIVVPAEATVPEFHLFTVHDLVIELLQKHKHGR
jgi:hypothetical protein